MISKSTIKYIQSLQHKKFRDEYGVFVAEGPKVVTGLLQSAAFKPETIFVTADWSAALKVPTLQGLEGCIEIVQDFELEKLAAYSTANKVVAVFRKREEIAKVNLKGSLTLALDDIRDPGNFGTIIRIADWFGIENIICSNETVDMYNNKVVQSTMASLGRVNLLYTNLYEWIKEVGDMKVFAATLEGKPLKEIGKVTEGLVVIGNESNGIHENILALATERVTIPRFGQAESLNAAVATGIILAEFVM